MKMTMMMMMMTVVREQAMVHFVASQRLLSGWQWIHSTAFCVTFCYIQVHSYILLHFVTVDPLKCILTICYSGSIELHSNTVLHFVTLKCLLTRCYILLHCIIVYYSMLQCVHKYISMDCSVLHCVAVHIGSLQWILVWKKAQAFKLWVWVIFWQPVKSWKEVVLKCEQVRGVVVVRGLP